MSVEMQMHLEPGERENCQLMRLAVWIKKIVYVGDLEVKTQP